MKKLWQRYLSLPQNIRFGIPVILGMMIVTPIAWQWLDRPPTCEEAKANQQRLDRRPRDGSTRQFAEWAKSTSELVEACFAAPKR